MEIRWLGEVCSALPYWNLQRNPYSVWSKLSGVALKPPKGKSRQVTGPQKKAEKNSYRIFYSLKYIPYTHSTCRIYSLLVPGILESRMSQETASVLGNSYRIFYSLKYIRIPNRPADMVLQGI